jgi:hypothetical protein
MAAWLAMLNGGDGVYSQRFTSGYSGINERSATGYSKFAPYR